MAVRITLEEAAIIANRTLSWARGLRFRGEFVKAVGKRPNGHHAALLFDRDEFLALLKARRDQGRHTNKRKGTGP